MSMSDAAFHLLTGSASGALGVLVDYPIDTLKTRVQVAGFDHLHVHHSTGVGRCSGVRQGLANSAHPVRYSAVARDLIHERGLRGFYRGASVPMAAQGIESGIIFSVYHTILSTGSKNTSPSPSSSSSIASTPSWQKKALAASAAGFAVSFVLTPVEYIKCNMQAARAGSNTHHNRAQASHRKEYQTSASFIRSSYQHHGLSGFYCGFVGTAIRAVPGNMAYFLTYDALKHRLMQPSIRSNHTLSSSSSSPSWSSKLYSSMIAGGCSGAAYWAVAYPADVVKTYLQVHQTQCERKSYRSVAQRIYRDAGLRGLYRGLPLAALRSFPSSAVVFTVHDVCQEMFNGGRVHCVAHV